MRLITASLLLLAALACAVIMPSDTLRAPPGHLRENGRNCLKCHESLGEITPASHSMIRFSREGHARQAVMDPGQCASCHRDRECLQCHRGRLPVQIHDPGYRFSHARDAKNGAMNCALCHPAGRFCGSCHGRR